MCAESCSSGDVYYSSSTDSKLTICDSVCPTSMYESLPDANNCFECVADCTNLNKSYYNLIVNGEDVCSDT